MACICPISIPDKVLSRFGYKGYSLTVPCGHCVGCARDKINDWFVRLYSVYSDYVKRGEPVWFVTVTIDPKLWPNMIKDSSGVGDRITPWMRSWNERLRYLNGGKMPLRFLCSEFGSLGEHYVDSHGVTRITTGALHFHGFLFGYLPIKDIQAGLALTHGHVDFERVRSSSCIRYAVKYATKDYSISDPLLRARTFCSPGLGDPSFYFGDSAPTPFVLINGFHYRCPRYLLDKQLLSLYTKDCFYNAFGRSMVVVENAIHRIQDIERSYKEVHFVKVLGASYMAWYLSKGSLRPRPDYSLQAVYNLLDLRRVGCGHPVLRHEQKVLSDNLFRSVIEEDRSFVNSVSPPVFINQFNLFDHEGHKTFLPLS